MIRNTDLAKCLSEKFGLSEKDGDAFVSRMIDVINDALHYERQVKIKGLGTFKVMSVESRESVDVNTGQRIVIEGRDKISFTPDSSMRERVNSPFAQFETVIINEGVDFSQIDDNYSENVGKDTSTVNENLNELTVPQFKGEENNSEKNIDESEDLHVSSLCEQTIETCDDNSEKEDNTSNHKNQQIMYDEEYLRQNSIRLNAQLDKLNEQLSDNIKRNNSVIKLLIATIVLMLLAFLASLFYFNRQLNIRDNYIQQLEAITLGDSVALEGLKKKDHKIESEKIKNDVQKEVKQKESDVVKLDDKVSEGKKNDSKEIVKQEAEPSKNLNTEKYNSDPRVKTGAYNIVGVETIVTVRDGQTLKSISKAYLGPDMECYVEALNGVNVVKAGDKLKIPKLQIKQKVKKQQ